MKRLVGRRATKALIVLALAASLSAIPVPAEATQVVILKVVNGSDHDVWMTVYWDYKYGQNWTILKAACLDKNSGYQWNGSTTFQLPALVPRIKVRAEVMNGDCRSGVYKDVSGEADVRTNVLPSSSVSGRISGYKGNYSVEVTASMM